MLSTTGERFRETLPRASIGQKKKHAGIKKHEGDILIRRFNFGAKNSLGPRSQDSPERE